MIKLGVTSRRAGRAFLLLLVAAFWGLGAPAALDAQSGQSSETRRITPDWLSYDKESRTVDLEITAGLTPANNGWNFNGYADGQLTIAVPLDWTVAVRFSNRDANYPHSVGVVVIEEKMPPNGEQVEMAFPRAFSLQFVNGLGANKRDSFDFKASKAGKFWLFCGVPAHGLGGMWDYFVVSEELTEPYVEVVEEKKE